MLYSSDIVHCYLSTQKKSQISKNKCFFFWFIMLLYSFSFFFVLSFFRKRQSLTNLFFFCCCCDKFHQHIYIYSFRVLFVLNNYSLSDFFYWFVFYFLFYFFVFITFLLVSFFFSTDLLNTTCFFVFFFLFLFVFTLMTIYRAKSIFYVYSPLTIYSLLICSTVQLYVIVCGTVDIVIFHWKLSLSK